MRILHTTFLLPLLAGCLGGPPALESSETSLGASGVVLNEFTPGSSGKIEIYNGGSTPVDLSSWQVDDIAGGGYAPKTLGAGSVVAAHGFLLVGYAGVNTASADSVRLVDASGVEVDSHANFYAGTNNSG